MLFFVDQKLHWRYWNAQAIKRLRQRLAIESLSSQQKQLERLEKAEVSPADNAVSQAHNSLEAKSEAPPLHARCLDFLLARFPTEIFVHVGKLMGMCFIVL